MTLDIEVSLAVAFRIFLASWRGCCSVWSAGQFFQKEILCLAQHSWKEQLHGDKSGANSCQVGQEPRSTGSRSMLWSSTRCLRDRHQKTAHDKYRMLSTQKCLFHLWWKLYNCIFRNLLNHRSRMTSLWRCAQLCPQTSSFGLAPDCYA